MDWVIGFALGLLAGGRLAALGPRFVLQAHADACRLWQRWRSHRRGGRPRLPPDLIALIRRLSLENPLWGAPRIHGELLKLGFQLSQSTVSKYMIQRRGRPTQTWDAFIRNNGPDIAAIDLLTVRTALFKRLYAFIVLAHDRRRILHIEATDHPTALWLAWQIRQALGPCRIPLYLVRDNDRLFGRAFQDEVRRLGLCDRPTRPRSPWQNGHCERLIGSIRRDCLDHHLIWNLDHLRRVLQAYADYYNRDRTHLALAKDSPDRRPIEPQGRIVATPVLGGLHSRYRRIQAK